MLPDINKFEVISLDTESTGLRYPRDKAFGVSVSTPDGKDYYWDLRKWPNYKTVLTSWLLMYKGTIVCHSASFDIKMLVAAGVDITSMISQFDCTAVRACLINEHESTIFPWTRGRGNYSLDYLGQKYLGIRKDQSFYDKARTYFGAELTNKKVMERIAELPESITAPYAMQDTRVCLDLWFWQQQEIETQGIQQIVAFEREVFPTLVRSELRGIDVCTETAERAQPKLTAMIDDKQRRLNEIVGAEFNVNSTPQVRKLFNPTETDTGWQACDGTPLELTKSGGPSFGGDALRHITHPAAPLIVEIRSLIKTRDTFLGSHILKHEFRGKVYPNINQCKGEDGGTGTGRLSYTEPAMQQIPARNKAVAEIVKPCFLPPQGMKWVEPDLASFEVRMFAHLVAMYNDSLQQAYAANPNLDFHQYVADLAGLVRNATYSGEPNAKQLNLSMIFNQGNGATADKMGMPWEWAEFTDKRTGDLIRYKKAGIEAMRVIEQYHRKVQGVKTLAERAKMKAESVGFIRTKNGRRLRFPKGYKSYKASGLLIQATSADENKRNWLLIEQALGNDGHLILNTHDSYSLACPEDWKPAYKRVKEAIEGERGLRVPLILDLDGAGDNWWEAKCGKEK